MEGGRKSNLLHIVRSLSIKNSVNERKCEYKIVEKSETIKNLLVWHDKTVYIQVLPSNRWMKGVSLKDIKAFIYSSFFVSSPLYILLDTYLTKLAIMDG